MSETRDQILLAAARLFAERGYAGTSIREVAASAGVSPALVMKVAGSKRELFHAVASFEPLDLGQVADADLAETLVRAAVARRSRTVRDPMTRAVALVLPSPSPDEIRERFATAMVDPLAARIGDRAGAEVAVSLLVGLAVSTRMLHLLPETLLGPEELVRRWTPLVQQVLDDGGIDNASPPRASR